MDLEDFERNYQVDEVTCKRCDVRIHVVGTTTLQVAISNHETNHHDGEEEASEQGNNKRKRTEDSGDDEDCLVGPARGAHLTKAQKKKLAKMSKAEKNKLAKSRKKEKERKLDLLRQESLTYSERMAIMHELTGDSSSQYLMLMARPMLVPTYNEQLLCQLCNKTLPSHSEVVLHVNRSTQHWRRMVNLKKQVITSLGLQQRSEKGRMEHWCQTCNVNVGYLVSALEHARGDAHRSMLHTLGN